MTLRMTKKARMLLTGLLLLGWFVSLRPASLGGPLGSVLVTGVSMEPTIRDGDLVLTRAQDSYVLGDVVAFDTGGAVVIHRIVGGSGDEGFVMQGDNNGGVDTWRPTTGDVIGKRWVRIPGLGARVRELQANPGLLGGVVGALVAIIGLRHPPRRQDGGNTPSAGPAPLPANAEEAGADSTAESDAPASLTLLGGPR